jgi:hypothetical protein
LIWDEYIRIILSESVVFLYYRTVLLTSARASDKSAQVSLPAGLV